MEFSEGVLTVYGPNETASIFATYPSEYISLGRSFLDQVSLTLDKSNKVVKLCDCFDNKQSRFASIGLC
jgi:hypothetical protein